MAEDQDAGIVRTAGAATGRTESAATKALAEHLGVDPQQIDDWLQRAQDPPPKVLRAWIRIWDSRRANPHLLVEKEAKR